MSVKARLGTDIWDIEHIVALPDDVETIVGSLLRHVGLAASEEGVQKVFLRSILEDPVTIAARQAGFFQYSVERIYWLPSSRAAKSSLALRPRRAADHHAIFQLYCSVVPHLVRQVEGITLQEWRWTEGWGINRVGWKMTLPRRRLDFVLDTDEELSAWLQVRTRSRTISFLARREAEEELPQLIRFGMSKMPVEGPVFCPVRHYQAFVEPALLEEGFQLVAEHALLAKSLAIRVPERKLVQVRAQVSH